MDDHSDKNTIDDTKHKINTKHNTKPNNVCSDVTCEVCCSQDLLSDGITPYERRFGQPFKGPIIPFGSLVEYHPFTAKDQSRIHQFGKNVLPGLFLGYALYSG